METIFVEHSLKGNDKTSTWFYFLISIHKEAAKCKKCGAVLKTKGGSTKGLHEHLKFHGIKLSRSSAETVVAVPRKYQKKTPYPAKKSEEYFPDVLANLVALDGIPFSVIANSVELRKSLQARKFEVPKSSATLEITFIQYYEEIRKKVKNEILEMKTIYKKFSICINEWISKANKRFLNIVLHGPSKFWNLGLLRIKGAATSENLIEIIEARLLEYDLRLSDDILSITTDGSKTLLNIGEIMSPNHQLCLAHAIQSGIVNVLYKKPPSHANVNLLDDDECTDAETHGQFDTLEIYDDDETVEITDDYDFNEIIEKVRVIVRYFKNSPQKNEILQNYVKMELKKEVNLISDCKTRWNSLLKMLERFLVLESSIKRVVMDLPTTCLEDFEFKIVKDVVEVLKPAELAIEALCRREMNLCSADAAIQFMINEIKKVDFSLAYDMYTSIKARVFERSSIYTQVLKFLSTSTLPSQCNIEELTESIVLLLKRHKKENLHLPEDFVSDVLEHDKTLEEKLEEALAAAKTVKTPTVTMTLEDNVQKEINLLLGGGNRGNNLELAYNYLCTIPPTSVECERCFSSSGRSSTKIRSSLADGTLDALFFLKSYLQKI